jgi:restriction system protein
MAEITRRRSGELVRGVFRLLSAHPEGLPAKIVLEKLVGLVPPTDFEQTTYPRRPDTHRYEKIVRFSTIGPVKAGWLVKDKGHWGLTEAGRKACEAFPDPEHCMREASRLYRQWALEQPTGAMADEPSPDAAPKLEEAEEAAWAEIEEHLETMNPYDFQDLVAGLLRGMGYYVAWVSPPGPDKGIDAIAHTDPLGIQDPRIKVQVKQRIMLVDLKRLFDLWVEHYDKIPEVQRRLLPIRPVYFLIPSE